MSNVQTNLIGSAVTITLKDGDESYVAAGNIAAAYYTGQGLMFLVALDADTSYRDSPKNRRLVEVSWRRVNRVTY